MHVLNFESKHADKHIRHPSAKIDNPTTRTRILGQHLVMLTVQVLHSKALKIDENDHHANLFVKSDNKKHNRKFDWLTNDSAMEYLSNAISNLIEICVKYIKK